MNVGQLKKMLDRYPEDMEVITSRCSDYAIVEESEWSIVQAVPQGWGVMRSHPTMSAENKEREKSYLHLWGN